MKFFMLDIETMGLNAKFDDILQIGILEVVKSGNGLYRAGREFQMTLFTEQEPKDAWIRENHGDLIAKCKAVGSNLPREVIREDILKFFKDCGVESKPLLMGLNLRQFDLMFMMEKGFLKEEDFHYRIYELTGAYNLAQDVLQIDRDKFFTAAHEAAPEIILPAGKKHEALFDCYSQLKTLNGSIRMLRRGMSV